MWPANEPPGTGAGFAAAITARKAGLNVLESLGLRRHLSGSNVRRERVEAIGETIVKRDISVFEQFNNVHNNRSFAHDNDLIEQAAVEIGCDFLARDGWIRERRYGSVDHGEFGSRDALKRMARQARYPGPSRNCSRRILPNIFSVSAEAPELDITGRALRRRRLPRPCARQHPIRDHRMPRARLRQ